MLRALTVWLFAGFYTMPAVAAGCFPVAGSPAQVVPASLAAASLSDDATLRLTFLGHASFLIETAGGASAITDYNGFNRASFPPDIVTMNNAHSTHWTDNVEPGVAHVLRGWSAGGGIAEHDVVVDDLRVRNVPTSVRGRHGQEWANSNSIFVFEVEDLCVAHLGHLHHALEDYHLAELGVIDILLVPADGMWTMPHSTAAAVVDQIRPSVVVPMHYFGRGPLEDFLAALSPEWQVITSAEPSVEFSRLNLPFRTVIVLPGS